MPRAQPWTSVSRILAGIKGSLCHASRALDADQNAKLNPHNMLTNSTATRQIGALPDSRLHGTVVSCSLKVRELGLVRAAAVTKPLPERLLWVAEVGR